MRPEIVCGSHCDDSAIVHISTAVFRQLPDDSSAPPWRELRLWVAPIPRLLWANMTEHFKALNAKAVAAAVILSRDRQPDSLARYNPLRIKWKRSHCVAIFQAVVFFRVNSLPSAFVR
jgi:hypothetical protein